LESNNEFELEHRRFLFYPTYVHQNPAHTKPEWRSRIEARAAEPEKVTLEGFGEARQILEVPSRQAMDRLFDLHPWDTPLIDMRFAYRPEKPLYLVVVRAYRLAAPVAVENTPEYAGCKSWVPLTHPIDVSRATPVLPDSTLDDIEARIRHAFAV
jgi:hypothetical protein